MHYILIDRKAHEILQTSAQVLYLGNVDVKEEAVFTSHEKST